MKIKNLIEILLRLEDKHPGGEVWIKSKRWKPTGTEPFLCAGRYEIDTVGCKVLFCDTKIGQMVPSEKFDYENVLGDDLSDVDTNTKLKMFSFLNKLADEADLLPELDYNTNLKEFLREGYNAMLEKIRRDKANKGLQ